VVPYWLLFSYFAAGVLLQRDRPRDEANQTIPLLTLGALFIALMIGLRYEVGADWFAYQYMFSFAEFAELGRVLAIGDPGYQFLNWVVQRIGGDLWLVNLICGLIFSWGLLRLAEAQPNPWLAVLVAIPYLVVVVAMGYTRQAVAIGILMAGLARVERGASTLQFALYVTAAAFFHKTAVFALPLVVLAGRRNLMINVMIGIAAGLLLYFFFLSSSVDRLVKNYIVAEYAAQGAAIRVAMSLVPAVLFLLNQRRFEFSDQEKQIWRNFALAAIGLLVILFVLPSSAAVDRLALYVTPLQIVILSRLPGAIGSKGLGTLAIVVYSAAVQFVWLNYAIHARFWVPYEFYPIFGSG
jgi:hypothetical protein